MLNSTPISFIDESLNELTILNNNLGSWNTKHQFFNKKFDQNSLFIHFVRDPRSWISAILWQNKFDEKDQEKIISLLVDNHIENHGDTYESMAKNLGSSYFFVNFSKYFSYVILKRCF